MRAKISKDVKKPKRNETEPSSLAIRVLDISFLSLFGIFFVRKRFRTHQGHSHSIGSDSFNKMIGRVLS